MPIPTKPSFAYYRPLRALSLPVSLAESVVYFEADAGNSIPAKSPRPENMLLCYGLLDSAADFALSSFDTSAVLFSFGVWGYAILFALFFSGRVLLALSC